MKPKKPKEQIILVHKRAPGDTLVLSGLVRDIQLAHPNRFEIGVDTSAMDLWKHNPHITKLRKQAKKGQRRPKIIKIQYGRGIREQNYETVHFLSYFHRDFERQTGFKVPPQLPYPDLHLSEHERANSPIDGRYWCFFSGGKSDFTAKVWHQDRFQEMVNRMNDMGITPVQLGGNDSGHWHPTIKHCLNLVGQTNLRDMMRLIHHSDGVVCGITCAMHMAAALHRPCVVLAGGREAWWWEAYVRENRGLGNPDQLKIPHRFLHTIGLLDCCKHHGCWRNKVIPLRNDKSICKRPIIKPGQPAPECMEMISVDHVMEAVMAYYTDKSLPPIGATPPTDPKPDAITPRFLDLFDDTSVFSGILLPFLP